MGDRGNIIVRQDTTNKDAGMGDNEHKFVVVDIPARKVSIIDGEPCPLPDGYKTEASFTFDEFIALPEDKLPEV